MKRPFFFHRIIATVAVLGAALGTASVAQAGPDVHVSIGLPGVPVLLPPPPPRPIFRAEPVYVQPRPVYRAPPAYVYERPVRPSYRYEAEREREWRHREWQRREWERRHPHWDRSPHREHHGWN